MEKKLLGKPVIVELSTDEDNISIQELENIYKTFEVNFTDEKLGTCIEKTAQELIDSIYQQSDDEPEKNELNDLIKDMVLARITVYSDAFMLFFTAQNIFPGDEIVVQINNNYEIEDMIVEEG